MDTRMSTAIRGLKASGEMDVVIKNLLNDCRLRVLQNIQFHITTLISGYRSKMVQKVFDLPEKELHDFDIILSNGHNEYSFKPTRVEVNSADIDFFLEMEVKHELSYNRTSLAGLGFNFGLHGADSDHLYPGEQLNVSFTLEAE